MKTYILTLIFTFALSLNGICVTTNGNEVPEPVSRSLESRYNGARVDNWKMENNLCIVRFNLGKEDYEAVFDRKGEWVRTGRLIKFASVPGVVSKEFKSSEYNSWKVQKVAEVQFSGFDDVTLYEMEVERSDKRQSLFYNDEGLVVMKVHHLAPSPVAVR